MLCSSDRRFVMLLGLPFLAGAILRSGRLGQQIVIDDEVHALFVASSQTVGNILSHYGGITDYSIPLTAFYRMWLDLGQPLTEVTLRAPSLVAGLAVMALVPWCLRRTVPRAPLLLLTTFIALSPWLVFYSRFARPYMPAMLTVFLAVVACRRFAVTGSWRYGLGYAALGAVSIYLFFPTAPVVLAPALWGLLFEPRGGRLTPRRATSPWVWLPVGGVLTLTILLLVPLGGDLWYSVFSHLGIRESQSVDRPAFDAFAQMFIEGMAALSGSQNDVIAGFFWLAVLRGAWVQRSTDPGLFRFCAFVVGCHLTVITFALYLMLSQMFPVAFARYLLVLLPVLYLWAALGVLTPFRESISVTGTRIQNAAVVLFVVLWIATGPLPTIAETGFQTSFAGSKNLFMKSSVVPGNVRGKAIYQSILRQSQPIVLESPGDPHDYIMEIYADNQRIHRGRVLVTDFLGMGRSRLNFANMIEKHPRPILGSEADFLVIHLDLFQEFQDRYDREIPPHLLPRADGAKIEARRLADVSTRVWGPPHYRALGIVAWDLDRIRSRSGVR